LGVGGRSFGGGRYGGEVFLFVCLLGVGRCVLCVWRSPRLGVNGHRVRPCDVRVPLPDGQLSMHFVAGGSSGVGRILSDRILRGFRASLGAAAAGSFAPDLGCTRWHAPGAAAAVPAGRVSRGSRVASARPGASRSSCAASLGRRRI